MKIHDFDLTSQDFKRDPRPTLKAMREVGTVFKVKMDLIGEVWVTTTYEAALRVLRSKDEFVVQPDNAGRKNMAGLKWWMPSSLKRVAVNMLTKDEPDHRRLRQLVESAFMQQSIDALRPRIAELVDKHLDGLQEQAGINNGVVDFIEDFARPFPLDVIGELLGLPQEDRLKFHKWGTMMTQFSNLKNPLNILTGLRGVSKINSYLQKLIDQYRVNPQPGMISALIEAEAEGHQLNKDELLSSVFLLLLAGHETTVHLLTVGLFSLFEHPQQKQAWTNDWSKSLTAVDELLRFNSTVETTKPRYAAKDLEFFGQHIKRGEVIMPLLMAANHDPAKFDDPDDFNLDRSPNPHVAFGTGIHVCLGQKLAHAEAEIAFERLFTRFPNLEIAMSLDEIEWANRIGARVIKRLPVKLLGEVG
ncbi:cytochrome P450 [Thalassoglobus sp.]|uniref:cytochrome P450 n=1 Tax=Thalassoglobus sp. TaxID=2795869 RepID=UPI003AA82F56